MNRMRDSRYFVEHYIKTKQMIDRNPGTSNSIVHCHLRNCQSLGIVRFSMSVVRIAIQFHTFVLSIKIIQYFISFVKYAQSSFFQVCDLGSTTLGGKVCCISTYNKLRLNHLSEIPQTQTMTSFGITTAICSDWNRVVLSDEDSFV